MKNYIGTTRTLESGQTGFKNVIFKPGKPPLESELNFVGDLSEDFSKSQLQALSNSGFIQSPVGTHEAGYDNLGAQFGINLTDTSNQLILKCLNGSPFNVNILGDIIKLGGTNSADESQVVVTLPSPPGAGSREDLVYLEVWYQQIVSQGLGHRPAANEVYAYGNVQSGLPGVTDDIFFGLIGTPTTDRVQVQYRVKVVPNVNFGGFPEGVNDILSVFAQAGMPTQSTYTFAPHASDKGLYVAGDGSTTAQTVLGSDDGYVYAIPLLRVHRRNASPFSLTNLNGAGKNIAQGNSDRPDGYLNDKIELGDLEDLRHEAGVAHDLDMTLDYNFKALLSGELGTALMESDNSNDVVHSAIGLQVDEISVIDNAGASEIAQPNDQRRAVSDAQTIQRTIEQFSLADRTFGAGINWTLGDQLTVPLALQSPVGSELGVTVVVTALVPGGALDAVKEIPITVNYLTNDYVITLGVIPVGVTTQDLSVDFDIIYPAGYGMTYVPENILKVYEVIENVNYSFVTTDDLDGIRPGSLVPTTGIASDYAIGLDEGKAFTTLFEYSVTGDGTAAYTIPAALGTIPVTHVYKVWIDGALVSRTVGAIKVVDVIFNGNDSITVTFTGGIPNTSTIKFFVALSNNAVLIDKQTKSIEEITESMYLVKTVNAGSNKTKIIFDAGTLVFSAQASAIDALDNQQSHVFVNGTETACTTVLDGNYIIVTLVAPVGVLNNDTVQVAFTRAKMLNALDQLQLYYQFIPYQGVTSRNSFNKGVDSFVETRPVEKAVGFLVHTSGTGGKNTTVNDNYSPMSVKLPLANAHKDGMLLNNPLVANTYPTNKGIDPAADLTIGGRVGFDIFESYSDWYDEGFDTQVSKDNYRTMFLRDTVRTNKVGVGSAVSFTSKDTINTNWSAVIDNAGNILGGQRIVFWYYVPNPTVLQDVALHLATDLTGTNDHIYMVTGGYHVGWNRAEFTARTNGTATTSTVVKVQFRFEMTAPGVTSYGMNIVPPYLEDDVSVPPDQEVQDGDIWFSESDSTLVKFDVLKGMYAISDGVGVEWFGDRAYAFDVPVIGGALPGGPSDKNSPYTLGENNLISKVGVVSNRGTFKGSNFYSVGMNTVTPSNKQTVMYMLEQVVNDPTGNFVAGEYVLRVETRIETNGTVRITNDDFDNLNAFDLYRCVGRPLGKI